MFMLSAVLMCGIGADPERELVAGFITSYLYGSGETGVFSLILFGGLPQFLPEHMLQFSYANISLVDFIAGTCI